MTMRQRDVNITLASCLLFWLKLYSQQHPQESIDERTMAVIVHTSDTGGRTMFIKIPTSNTTKRAIPKPLPSSSDDGIKVTGVVGEETTAP